jgi:urease accessory protein
VSGAERLAEVGRNGRGAGVARVGFRSAGGATRLALLEQRTPLRVLFPRVPAGDVVEAVLINTGGGVVGGDRLEVALEAGAGARVRATTQAAEKIYRSAGSSCALDVRLAAGRDAWLEWLPQETILFDGCRIGRQLVLDLAPGARALAGEMMVFGRAAHGESMTKGAVSDRWWLRRDGRLLWADALRLDGALAPCLTAPFGFAGARALATLLYVAEDAAAWLEPARALVGAGGVISGVTCLPGVLIGRWLSADAQALRIAYGSFVVRFRALVAGLPPRLPTVWQI